jgi:hypothetical protein
MIKQLDERKEMNGAQSNLAVNLAETSPNINLIKSSDIP